MTGTCHNNPSYTNNTFCCLCIWEGTVFPRRVADTLSSVVNKVRLHRLMACKVIAVWISTYCTCIWPLIHLHSNQYDINIAGRQIANAQYPVLQNPLVRGFRPPRGLPRRRKTLQKNSATQSDAPMARTCIFAQFVIVALAKIFICLR